MLIEAQHQRARRAWAVLRSFSVGMVDRILDQIKDALRVALTERDAFCPANAYRLFQRDPWPPRLRFKPMHPTLPIHAVRISSARAISAPRMPTSSCGGMLTGLSTETTMSKKPHRSHEKATIESFREDPKFAVKYLHAVLEDGDDRRKWPSRRRVLKWAMSPSVSTVTRSFCLTVPDHTRAVQNPDL